MHVNIEDYCALDDSSFRLKMRELGYAVSIYVNTLVSYPNSTTSLVIARPTNMSFAGETDIRNFLLDNVGERKLISCNHYSMYDWMEEEFGNNLEFITRKSTKKFPQQIQKMFKYADRSSHTLSAMLGSLFTQENNYRENRERLVDAVASSEDTLNMGLEIKLRGLYITAGPKNKPNKKKS